MRRAAPGRPKAVAPPDAGNYGADGRRPLTQAIIFCFASSAQMGTGYTGLPIYLNKTLLYSQVTMWWWLVVASPFLSSFNYTSHAVVVMEVMRFYLH